MTTWTTPEWASEYVRPMTFRRQFAAFWAYFTGSDWPAPVYNPHTPAPAGWPNSQNPAALDDLVARDGEAVEWVNPGIQVRADVRMNPMSGTYPQQPGETWNPDRLVYENAQGRQRAKDERPFA